MRPFAVARAVRLAATVTGAIVFALPFVWLLLSSMKSPEEVFAVPTRWLPATVSAVAVSPWVDVPESPEPPSGVSRLVWDEALRLFADLLRRRGIHAPEAGRAQPHGPTLSDAVARDLTARQSQRHRHEWQGTTATTLAALLHSATDSVALAESRERRLRAVLLGALYVTGLDGQRRPLGDPGGHEQMLTVGGQAGRVWSFDRDSADTWRRVLPTTASVAADSLVDLRLSIRGDKSYHEVWVEWHGPQGCWRAVEPFSLSSDRWMTAVWSPQVPTLRERRTVFAAADLLRLDRLPAHHPPRPPGVHLERRPVGIVEANWTHLTRNVRNVFVAVPYATYLRNSLLLVLLNVIGHLAACSAVAYGFSRLRWPGRDAVFVLMLATMMLPSQVTMVPEFLLWRALGQYDTLRPLWVPSFFGAAFYIFLMRQFMLTMPRELEEAATIDGAGYVTTFLHVIVPLLKPALAAVAVFSFLGTWNDFLGPLIYLSSEELAPLSLGLFRFKSSHFVTVGGEIGLLMAGSLLMTLPVVALFFGAQGYFLRGITFTGVKG